MRNRILEDFIVEDLPLNGLKLIKRKLKNDNRGFFSNIYSADQLSLIGFSKPISQINHSFSSRIGTIRGMHYQTHPYIDTKLINLIRGEIVNVVVDLRVQSSTFMASFGMKLTEAENVGLLIPAGFAQGFQTISNDVDIIYCHTERYVKDFERGLNPFDPALSIDWPLPVSEISERDKNHQFINANFKGL
jgi:dTDP-4-dehydrorhamnose 3,5-epimerase